MFMHCTLFLIYWEEVVFSAFGVSLKATKSGAAMMVDYMLNLCGFHTLLFLPNCFLSKYFTYQERGSKEI